MNLFSIRRLVPAVLAFLTGSGVALAADITWDPPEDITGDLSDFTTAGSFELGWTGGNTGTVDIVIPGVGTFTPGEQLQRGQYNSDSDNNWETVHPAAQTDYTNLLEFAQWSNNGEKDSVTLPNLTPGTTYRLQVWAADTRNCCSGGLGGGWEKSFGDGNGNNVTVTAGNYNSGVSNTAPQYVIGRFTADAPTQTLQFPAAGNGNAHPQYNALMLHTDVAVTVTTFTGAVNDDLGEAGNWDQGLPTGDGTKPGTVPDGNVGLTGDPGNTQLIFEGNSGYDGGGFGPPGGSYRVTFTGSGDSNFSGGGLNVPAGSRLVWDSSGTATATQLEVAGALRLSRGALRVDDLTVSGSLVLPQDSSAVLQILDANQDVAAIEALVAGGQISTTNPLGLVVSAVDVNGTLYTQVNVAVLGRADIAWGDPQDVTGALEDFDLTGPVVLAWSGDNNPVTIQGLGLDFVPGASLANGVYNSDSDGNFAIVYPGADPDYDNLLQNAAWGNTALESLILDGLTPGTDYKVQIWTADVRNCCSGDEPGGWEKTFGDGNGNNVTITAGNLDQTQLPNVAPQFVVGTFTAEAPTQNLDFINQGQGNSHPQYNALLLSVNVPAAPPVQITNISYDLTAGMIDLSWSSLRGKLYNVRSSLDPEGDGDPASWPIFGGLQDIAAAPPENSVSFAMSGAERYFVIEVFDAPPIAVFSDDLEGGQGSWTFGSDDAPGINWELGSPMDDGIGPVSAFSGTNCWGTDLDMEYVDNTDVWLRTPPIDLTGAGGATLSYMEFKDIETMFDSGSVAVLDASDDSELAVITPIVEGTSVDWTLINSAIPAAALDKVIKIEFRLDSDEFQNQAGWYLDDVSVTVP